MKLRHSARTDVGKTRDHNEDSYGVGSAELAEQLGELLVVCDGMGGHAAGEVASKIGTDTILAVYYGDSADDRQIALVQAFEQANSAIFARGQGSMGTTGVAALLHHDALLVANVGDSRAYLIRDGEIRQVSRDHSFVSDQVAAGLITPEQARFSPHRNVITRALGYQPEVTVDIFRLPLQLNDAIVLSSDGLHGLMSDSEILQIVTTQPPDQATQALIELANSRGGTDNITVVLAQVDALEWYGATPALGSDAPDDEPEELHERTTVELPVTGQFAADAAPEVPIAPDSSATPPAVPAPPMPPEPRLNWRGLALALGLLVVLIAIILFAAPTLLAPGTSPTSPPATTTTAVTTPAPTPPGSTAAPGAAPTVAPAPGTALPTGTTSKSSY